MFVCTCWRSQLKRSLVFSERNASSSTFTRSSYSSDRHPARIRSDPLSPGKAPGQSPSVRPHRHRSLAHVIQSSRFSDSTRSRAYSASRELPPFRAPASTCMPVLLSFVSNLPVFLTFIGCVFPAWRLGSTSRHLHRRHRRHLLLCRVCYHACGSRRRRSGQTCCRSVQMRVSVSAFLNFTARPPLLAPVISQAIMTCICAYHVVKCLMVRVKLLKAD
jgi:hypothetical protein